MQIKNQPTTGYFVSGSTKSSNPELRSLLEQTSSPDSKYLSIRIEDPLGTERANSQSELVVVMAIATPEELKAVTLTPDIPNS